MLGRWRGWLILLAGVWLTLVSSAAALGYGHRDTGDCPHCELLALDRRRHIDRGVFCHQSRILAERPALASRLRQVVATLPPIVTRVAPCRVAPERPVFIDPSDPAPNGTNASHLARGPPLLSQPATRFR